QTIMKGTYCIAAVLAFLAILVSPRLLKTQVYDIKPLSLEAEQPILGGSSGMCVIPGYANCSCLPTRPCGMPNGCHQSISGNGDWICQDSTGTYSGGDGGPQGGRGDSGTILSKEDDAVTCQVEKSCAGLCTF